MSGSLRIGEMAARAGVSPRTLRYYEELGLLVPTGHTPGGARRYSERDLARLLRVRELQELLGFDLGAIGEILRAEDQLADLRRRYQVDEDVAERRAIVEQAGQINAHLRTVVRAKQQRLGEMMRDLESKARRYRARARELSEEPDAATARRTGPRAARPGPRGHAP